MIAGKIHLHLDKIEDIKTEIKADVGRIIKHIDLEVLIKKPDQVLKILQDTIIILAKKKIIGAAVLESKRFVDDVRVETKEAG